MEGANIHNVCVRAYIEGKWRSATLAEVVEHGNAKIALGYLHKWLLDLGEGEAITVDHIQRGLDLINLKRKHEEGN